jgi:RNA polymerase sigma-70 factor (ECF subfamily)
MEYPGIKLERGAEAIRTGSFQGTLFGCPEGRHVLGAPARSELRAHRGEPFFLWWSGDEVHALVRVELAGERVARLVNHYHAPELLTEVCRELEVPFRTHGYHPGSAWFEELS